MKTRDDVVRILLLGAIGLGLIGLVFIDAEGPAYLSPSVRVSSAWIGFGLLAAGVFALVLGLMARQQHAATRSLLQVGRNVVVAFGIAYLGWFAWSIVQTPPQGFASPWLFVAAATLILVAQIYYIWTWCDAALMLLGPNSNEPVLSR